MTPPSTAAGAPRVLIVGSGAIGSFYGALLNRAGARVSVVMRSEAEVVRANGLQIRSALGDLSFRPEQVLGDVAECQEAPDYLLLCTKVLDDVDRAALIRPAVGPKTTILLIQNGIDIERDVAAAFPGHTLLSALAFVGVSRVAPGVVEHKAYGSLTIGRYPQGIGSEAEQLAALFEKAGIGIELSGSVVTQRWRKAVWNAAFNPLSVLADGADTGVLLGTPEGEALVRGLMAEVCAAAAADGHALDAQLIDQYIASTKKMPPYRNSMALDWIHGRPIELQAILGNVLAAAARHGTPVPQLQTVHTAIRLLQASRAQGAAS